MTTPKAPEPTKSRKQMRPAQGEKEGLTNLNDIVVGRNLELLNSNAESHHFDFFAGELRRLVSSETSVKSDDGLRHFVDERLRSLARISWLWSLCLIQRNQLN